MFDSTSLQGFARAASVSFVALFPAVNPFRSAPIFHGSTKAYSREVQQALARKVAFYGSATLIVSLVAGVKILDFLGVSLSAVQVAGGLVAAHSGWRLFHEEPQSAEVPVNSMETALGSAFYPLTLPLTVGPGSISIAIAVGAHLNSQHAFEMHTAAIAGIAALCALVWAVYSHAHQLADILGPIGINILVRLSALALFAFGIQIVWTGIRSALHLA